MDEVRGHLMFAMPETRVCFRDCVARNRRDCSPKSRESAEAFSEKHEGGVDGMLDKVVAECSGCVARRRGPEDVSRRPLLTLFSFAPAKANRSR